MAGYKLLEQIGQGAMGVVYRAVHPDLKREVAIKFLPGKVEDIDPVIVARFKREMSVLIGLSHPNIIKVFDAVEEDGKLHYVMELVRGHDLARMLEDGRKLSIDQGLKVLDHLLDAIDLLHSKGIVHRDIKPSNVMIDEAGRAILMDFGVVRVEDSTVLTAKGMTVGTPLYLSPQVMLGEDAGKLDDLWSLGVTIYEALAGTAPFRAFSLAELLTNVLKKDIMPLSVHCPDLPPPMEKLIHRLLEREPERRWPGAREAREDLLAWADGPVEEFAPSGTGRVAARPRTTRSTKRKSDRLRRRTDPRSMLAQVLPTMGAILGLGLVIGLTFLWLGIGRPREQVLGSLLTRYETLDRLVVTFSTGRPEKVELRFGGQTLAEAGPGTEHRFELPVSPFDPVEGLAAKLGDRSIDIPTPLCPGDSISRLSQATRGCRLDEAAIDRAWSQTKPELLLHLRELNVQSIVETVATHPETAVPFERACEEWRRCLTGPVEAARPFVAPLLWAQNTPPAIRDELLGAVLRLDRVDALASYLGRPPVFGVQRMLEPTVLIKVSEPSASPTSLPVGETLFPPPGRPGVVLIPEEVGAKAENFVATIESFILGNKSRLANLVPSTRLAFDVMKPAGSRRLHVRCYNLGTQVYLLLVGPGLKEPLPIRLPDGIHPLGNRYVWLTIELQGVLTRTGRWTATQGRAFQSVDRYFFAVDDLREECAR